MEDTNSKRGQLKAIVLLLIGFVIGFATHAFTVAEEAAAPEIKDGASEELVDTVSKSDEKNNGSDIPPSDDNSKENKAKDSKSGSDTAANGVLEEPFNATPNNSSNGGYSFSVVDQTAGGVVYVSQLVFAKEIWIAVREDNDGKLGNILGARRYPVGEHSGAVELLRDTEPGQTYYVVIYLDDGDKLFDHKKDILMTDEEQNVTAAIFRTY